MIPSYRPIALLAVASLLLAGCGKKLTNVEEGDRDQVLHIGNGSEPQDIDSTVVTGIPEHQIISALIEGLVAEDPKDLHPVPGVAESWDISPDAKTYTFHLRHNAKWSNGDPVTAKDFLFTYQRILSPKLGGEYAYMLFCVVNAEAFNKGDLTDFSQVGFRAPDDYTLAVTLKAVTPYFLSLLNHYSWWPVHQETILKFGAIDQKGTLWTRPGNFVGNGPFVLDKWEQNQILTVKKSDTYWDKDTVKLKEIRFYPIENVDTEERAFRAGQLHHTNSVPAPKIDVYKKEDPQALHIDPYLGSYFYRLNVTRKPLDDVRVRRALAMAVDRESLVKNVTRGGQLPANNFTPPGTGGYTAEARIPTDFEGARKLLTEAGYPGGAGLPPIEILINTDQNHKDIAEAIQQMWRKELGVDARIVNQEWKVYLDAQTNLDYTICRAGWIGDYGDPQNFLDMWVTNGGNNKTGYSNPKYDALIEKVSLASSNADRFPIFQEAEKMIMDEVPIIPIYFYTRVSLSTPSLKGWYPNILDHHPYKYVYLEAAK